MTFHTDLIADAVLPTDIRTTLGLTGDVYVGRRPRAVTSDSLEVWIERNKQASDVASGVTSIGTDVSRRRMRVHVYDLHIRQRRGTQGSDGAGALQVTDIEDAVDKLKIRYDGKARLSTALAGLISISAQETNFDVAPGDTTGIQEAIVRLTFVVNA